MIGDAALREVVGADLLGSLAGAHLAAAILRDGFLLLAHLDLVEPRAQHLHRLRAILDLRLLVLLRDDQPGRQVRDSDRRVRRVHALAAGSARAERIDADVLLVDLDVDFLGFGQHRDGGRGRVDPAAAFGRRHALDAVDAALVLQLAVDALALDRRDGFLDAADAGLAERHHLELPALALGEAAVHAEQLAGKERRLVAAGAGADFEQDVLLVVGILRQQQDAHLLEQRRLPRLEILQLLPGERGHLGSPPRTSSCASRVC